jgi:Flp pilus assembly protein TadG
VISDGHGMVAVEFALLLPIFLALFIVGMGLSDGIACARKVTTTAKSLADLTARYSSVTSGDVTTILNASAQILAPYDASKATERVSEVQVTGTTSATVVWSRAANGNALAAATAVTIPSGMAATGSYLILGEVSYVYTPLFTFGAARQMVLYDAVFMSPRMSDSVPLS